MKKRFKDLIETIAGFFETSHPVIIVLILAIVIMAAVTGHKYYQFIKNDPEFCELCHVMKETFKAWQQSAHRNTVCQTCHSMSLLGQNRLLMSYVLSTGKSSASESHAKITPWDSCNACHLETAKQGGITLRKSYGHARHVFMEKIECKTCHTADMHNFEPDEKNCLECHQDKGVHGMGMESFACLSCHVYGEVTAMPTKQRCIKCHKELPQKGPMSSLDCRSCHKPHSKVLPSANECMTSCHTNQESIGRHDKHMDISCLECHKAHKWKVGQKLAEQLCTKCHKFKDPLTFIF